MNTLCPYCNAENDCYRPPHPEARIPVTCEDCDHTYLIVLTQDEEGHVDMDIETEVPVS